MVIKPTGLITIPGDSTGAAGKGTHGIVNNVVV
jgi:hypothetical protein